MTLSVSTQVSPVGSKLIVQTSASSVPDNNVTGTSGSIYMIDIDNTANVAASYLKIYDDASPTVGSSAPDSILKIAGSQRRQWVITEGADFSQLSFACVTTGGTAGTADPASPVVVRIVTS